MPLMKCVSCSRRMDTQDLAPRCSRCGSAVTLAVTNAPQTSKARVEGLQPGVWRFRDFLPQIGHEDVVTLGEGATPLLHAERLGEELGLRHLLLKDETRNPTGSFLDRGSTVLLSLARLNGIRECSCDTTGNLGASLSAYCAKAGIKAHIRVNPNADQGKLFQMLAYGAEIEASVSHPLRRGTVSGQIEVTAANPYLLEGEKTTGFEVFQELGWSAPDVIVVPIGTGGHLSMIWRSFMDLREAGLLDGTPCRLLGVKLGNGVQTGSSHKKRPPAARGSPLAELEDSEPFFIGEAKGSIAASRGAEVAVSAAEVLSATGLLARTEGIFAEPSSASVVASLPDAVRSGLVRSNETVVCVVTGAGLKDTRAVSRLAKQTKRVALREGFATRSPTIGETKLEILRLLRKGPGYGYELWLLLGSRRRISTASVYQHLSELEELSLVRRTGSVAVAGRERVVYDLTKKGSDFLKMMGKLGD